MQIKVFFFWNFRNIQTATLIRKRIISALIDKARNSTEGKQQKIKSAHGCARRDAKNKIEAELKLLVGDVILLGIQSRINRRNRHSAWATPALSTFRAGLWRLWPRKT